MPTYTEVLRLQLVDFAQRGWDNVVNDNFTLIDAAIAQSVFLQHTRGTWQNDELYVVNDLVYDEDTDEMYKALEEHTSAASGSFGDERTAEPTYWEFVDTATASAAAAAIEAANAEASATAAAASVVSAAAQATDALTHATSSYNFAVVSSDAAAAAATAAIAAATFGANMRPWATFDADDELTKNYTLTVAEGIILGFQAHTTEAFTGATVDLRIGTTVGGNEFVDDTDIKALGVHALVLEDAAVVSFTPFGGGTIHVTITQTTPTDVGQVVVAANVIPTA